MSNFERELGSVVEGAGLIEGANSEAVEETTEVFENAEEGGYAFDEGELSDLDPEVLELINSGAGDKNPQVAAALVYVGLENAVRNLRKE